MALEEKDNTENSSKNNLNTFVSLNAMFKELIKIWWLFLIVGLIAGVFGVFYASKKRPSYKSRLTFALDDGDGRGIGNFLNLASQFGISVGGAKDIFAGDNIIDIMKSRRMIERVLLSIDTFNNKPTTLIEYFLDITDKRESNQKFKDVHFPPGHSKSNFTYLQDSILYITYLDFANKYLEAQRPDKKLSIYEVNITSLSEKFTKIFTDRLVLETNSFYIEIRTKKAKETLDILEARVGAMKGNLNSSITNRATVQDVNINPAFSAAQVPVMKQQANIQVYSSAYTELFKNLELARFQYLNEIPLMQIIDPADYPMEKIKLGKLKTGIIFSIVACLLLIFIFWFKRIVKLSNLKTSK
ncbi:MAG: Wzz/FepE/Etk N-terminal domain-containing protein [Ginsengibacter sp.]